MIVRSAVIYHNGSMEDQEDFLTQLTKALQERLSFLEQKELPKLKEQFRVYYTAFQSIYNLVKRKGLVQEDPYQYDEKISEVTIPDKTPFSDSEKIDKIGIRLAAYDNQLDFLTNYYQYSTEFLNLQRIKNLVGLIQYFRWANFSERSEDLNTRALAGILENIKGGSDKVSTDIVIDAINQLKERSARIQKILKELSDYHRQLYKRDLREYVLEPLNLTQQEYKQDPDGVTKKIKQQFAETLSHRSYYSDLVHEVLKEDFTPEGAELKEKILKSLSSTGKKKVKEEAKPDQKQNLLEAVRELSRSNVSLEACYQKILEADKIINERPNTMGEKLRQWLNNWLNKGKTQQKIITVEIFDPVSSITKPERIDYNNFMGKLKKKIQIFTASSNKLTNFSQKLQNSPEDKIHEFLQRQINDMQKLYHQLEAMDTYYKAEATKEQRRRIRGLKVDLTNINNNIRKANQLRHEYVAEKEEAEQLKKLGITGSESSS